MRTLRTLPVFTLFPHARTTPLAPLPGSDLVPPRANYPIDPHSLLLHFMTESTGLENLYPDGWPEWAKFDSTISFTIAMPEGRWACNASWPVGALPGEGTWISCSSRNDGKRVEDERIREQGKEKQGKDIGEVKTDVDFMIRRWYGLGIRRAEMSVMLGVRRNVTCSGGHNETWYGERPLYSGDRGPMLCLLGKPLDGMRCTDLGGPLVVNATRVER